TRSYGNWSSDVCSSDLLAKTRGIRSAEPRRRDASSLGQRVQIPPVTADIAEEQVRPVLGPPCRPGVGRGRGPGAIGRISRQQVRSEERRVRKGAKARGG